MTFEESRQRRRLIAFAYAQRISYEAICDRFLCSEMMVWRACREFGVKLGLRRESPAWKRVDWTRTAKQIAAEVGVNVQAVYKARRRYQVPPPSPRRC